MDQSFYDKVIGHTAVHSAVLELARLEGLYAGAFQELTKEQREELSAKIQGVIHDVVTQACRVGLRRGYIDALEKAGSWADNDYYDFKEAVETASEADAISRYVYSEAFK